MTAEKKLLICVIVFLVIYLAWCAVLIFAVSKSERPKKKAKFDERQIAAQGMAYKWAFFSMLGYYLLYMIVCGAGEIVWCDDILGMWLGVVIGVTVLCVICIFRDAYFRPDQSQKGAIICINLIGISQGMLGILHLSDGTVVENGVLTGDSMQLFFLAMLLVIDAAFIIKHCMDRREAQE